MVYRVQKRRPQITQIGVKIRLAGACLDGYMCWVAHAFEQYRPALDVTIASRPQPTQVMTIGSFGGRSAAWCLLAHAAVQYLPVSLVTLASWPHPRTDDAEGVHRSTVQ